MTLVELLSTLRARDINLWAEDDRLRYNAPPGALTPDLREELAKHKADILTFLNETARARRLTRAPISRISREARLLPTINQRRLWFIEQLQPNTAFNCYRADRIKGPLNIASLEQSLNEIVRRHEALRTTFSAIDGEPFQVIAAALELRLKLIDLRDIVEATERETEAERIITEEVERPFGLAQGPLLRAHLLRLGADEHVLLLTIHHIVTDGWSMGILVKELTVLYECFCHGCPSPLPELPIQYADFAHWQSQYLQGEALQQELSYWKERLEGAPQVTELLTDYSRPAVQSFQGASEPVVISKSLTEALKTLSKSQGVTLFMTLLAAFKTLLYRYSGQEDLVLGSPIAGRMRGDIENLIGLFINTLVLRTDLSGNPTFRELLRRVREGALEAYTHQEIPFEKLIEDLHLERSLSFASLFQVMFVLQNTPEAELKLLGSTVSPVAIQRETTLFDLFLSIAERDQGLHGTLSYRTDLFDSATISRMISQFRVLLDGIVADPDRPISTLPLLMETEKHQLLVEWNDSKRDYPQDRCVHELFEAQVERTPDAVAVVFGDQQLTYGELNQRANQLAHHLRKRGVGPEVLVGIWLERSVELLVGLLGVLKSGGAYVPLDPNYPMERLAFILQDTQPRIVLTQHRLTETFSDIPTDFISLDAEWEIISQESEQKPVVGVNPDNLAYLIYTSGSTGKPKGVEIGHRALLNFTAFARAAFELGSSDRVLQFASISFDAAAEEIYPSLMCGATLVLRSDSMLESAASFLQRCADWEVTVLDLPTAYWHELAEKMFTERLTPPDALRLVIIGGENALPERLGQWQKAVGDHVRLLNTYGPTEATVVATMWEPGQSVQTYGSLRAVPIGRPVANAHTFILDKYSSPMPIAVPGELHVGGIGLARGYFNRPDLTAEKFIPNPFSCNPGERLYKTGDLVRYLGDGNIEFLGRLDNQVKIRGFRIELGEIESTLTQHAAVQKVAVVAREDVPGKKRLVAYVVLAKQQVLTSTELRTFVKAKLPDYMVPSVFVFLDALPLTASGKVNRKTLPAPDQSKTDAQKSFVAPRTSVEETLARIWGEVLKVERVGIHDNFFELGGDSILTIQIVARVNREGLRLTPRQLFEHQTVAELAVVAGKNGVLSAEQGLVTGKLPLTAIQRSFFEANFPAPHHWNMAMLLEAPQVLNPILLEKAVQQLVLHHDALRMRFFREQPSGWQQEIVQPQENSVFSYIDLSGLEEAGREGAIKLAAAELQGGLNLAEGPLMRVALFDLGSKQNSRLLLIVHHLVVDGVSLRILIEDLQTAYQQLSDSRPLELPAKTTSFKQWAERITEYARSSSVQKEIDYWLTASNRQVFHLPVDYAGDANTESSIRTVSGSLTDKETQALLHEVPKIYHSQINDVLLTALVQTFSAWTGEASLLIELEGHGREELFEDLDLSRTVGWFTTCFPVYLEIQNSAGPGESVKLIKEQLRSIPNRGIGFGLLYYLSESTAIAEQLRRLPQPEISFNYLGQFDQVLPPSSPFVWGTESAGPTRSPFGNRRQLLAVTGRVKQDRLMMNWNYSENLYRRATIERLAQSFVNALRDLISHSQSPQAEAYTPSDFPGAKLSQKALDGFIARLSETGARKST